MTKAYETDSNTLLLIHSENADSSTSFADSSGNGHSINVAGNAQHKTSEKKVLSSSIRGDGDGDRIDVSHADFAFGTSDFTIEGWVRADGSGSRYLFVGTLYTFNLLISISSPTKLGLFLGNGSSWSVSDKVGLAVITDAAWHHVALVRSGDEFSVYVDGILDISHSATPGYSLPGNAIGIMGHPSGVNPTSWWLGYVDEIRVSDIARYTESFDTEYLGEVPVLGVLNVPLSDSQETILDIDFRDPEVIGTNLSMGYGLRFDDSLQVSYSSSLSEILAPGLGQEIQSSLRIRLNEEQIAHETIPLPMRDSQVAHTILSIPLATYNQPQIAHTSLSVLLGNHAVISHSLSIDILLNGASISHLIINARVTYDEKSPHNTIEIEGIAPQLYYDVKEIIDLEKQIELQTDGQSEFFLLETISGDIHHFQLWGRSLSASYSADKTTSDVTIEDLRLVSDVAKDGIPALTWETEDWLIDQVSFSGSPISISKELAEAVGAVVRCKIDGSIYVRPVYPVIPLDMQTADYIVKFTDSEILAISKSNKPGNGYNQLDIYGPALDDLAEPDIIVVSDPVPMKDGDAFIRLYFPTATPPDLTAEVSAGDIVEDGAFEETVTDELITFDGGFATSQFPIAETYSWEWIGYNSASINAVQFSRTLECTSKEWGIGKLSYLTNYVQYRCYNHSVDVLLGLIEYEAGPDVSIRAILGDGGSQNPSSISDDLIRNKAVATARAATELYSNYYDRDIISLSAPLTTDNKSLIDGDLVLIQSSSLDISNIAKITKVEREYNEKQIINIEAELCHLS